MSKSPAVSDISKLLKAVDQESYVAALISAEEKKAAEVEKRGSNAATRKAAQVEGLVKSNKKIKGCTEDIAPSTAAVRTFMAKSKALASILNKIDGQLTAEQALIVMDQMLDGKLLKELVEATYEVGRDVVFSSMTAAAAEAGEDFPENVPAVLDVPEKGKRFVREATGRKDSSLDEDKLAELVGPEVWEQITTEHTIPAVVVRKVDEVKLVEAAKLNPALLEQVREAIVLGDWKSPRLTIKNIPPNEKE